MRLIDADDFDVITYKETESYSDCFDSGVLYMLDRIDAAPTVDAVEVVHGHWIEWDDTIFNTVYRCSVCGEDFAFIDGTTSDNLYNYCPNCGAKMKGTD